MGVWSFLVTIKIQGNHENVSGWALYSAVAVKTTASRFSFLTSGTRRTRRTVITAFARRSCGVISAIMIAILIHLAIFTQSFSLRVAFVVGLGVLSAGDAQRTLPLLEGGTRLSERAVTDGHGLVTSGHELLANPVGSFGIRDQHQLLHVARIEALVEELLADEYDASVAQSLVLPKEGFRYRLTAIFD